MTPEIKAEVDIVLSYLSLVADDVASRGMLQASGVILGGAQTIRLLMSKLMPPPEAPPAPVAELEAPPPAE